MKKRSQLKIVHYTDDKNSEETGTISDILTEKKKTIN